MKKLMPLFLALAICLCAGCGEVTPSATPTPAPTPTQTPAPTPAPTPEPEIIYEVQTDYSQYTAYEKDTVESIYTRLSEDWIDDLAPRDDYGMLYPFVGSLLFESSYVGGQKYGLFDQNGRIVCDPVYSEVSRLSSWDYSGVYGTKTDYPMLKLTRIIGDRSWTTLCSLDGSFVSPESYTYVAAFDFGVVCSADWLGESFVVYDYEGNVMLTEADFPTGTSSALIENGDSETILLATEEGHYFLDLKGNVLHGPYDYALRYHGDYAAVRDVRWGLVGKDGKYVIPAEYNNITRGHGSHYICTGYTSTSKVIDAATGEVLLEVPSGNELQTTYLGYRTWKFGPNWQAEDERYYDKNCAEIILPEGEWNGTGETPLLSRLTEDGLELYNVLSGERAIFEGMETAMPLYRDFMSGLPSSLQYVQLTGAYTEGQDTRFLLVSWDLQRSYEMSMYDIHNCVVIDEITGEEYIKLSGRLYDKDMAPLSTGVGTIWNGLVISYDSIWCSATDFEGKAVFHHPLMMSDGD